MTIASLIYYLYQFKDYFKVFLEMKIGSFPFHFSIQLAGGQIMESLVKIPPFPQSTFKPITFK
jgi:hypothetical protein